MNYEIRISNLTKWMSEEDLSAALFVDVEGRRDVSVRYLTGHPGDALLFVLPDSRTILIPWDINLAHDMATAGEMIPYSEFERSLTKAVEHIVARESLGGRIEVSAATPYPIFSEISAVAKGCTVVCRSEGLDDFVGGLRMVKDEQEMESIDRAASITNDLLDSLESLLDDSKDLNEVDVALFLEGEALRRGCDGMSFESLVAGPSRSFGIHAFPAYSAAPFGVPGMSILDFGVLVGGYPSDVTVTVVRGKASRKQEEMIELVQQAYEQAAATSQPGVEAREIAQAVDEIFARHGYAMPHSLGHGLGLQVHEKPYLRNKPENRTRLENGMVFTIEPGLYDPEAGGIRLENDFLVTADGTRVLTTARILRLP